CPLSISVAVESASPGLLHPAGRKHILGHESDPGFGSEIALGIGFGILADYAAIRDMTAGIDDRTLDDAAFADDRAGKQQRLADRASLAGPGMSEQHGTM